MVLELYPLKFQPIFRQYLWGGRRLGEFLHKPIGEGATWAESWEVVDRDADQSVVANGPLQGTTLRELIETRRSEMLGNHARARRFPLLLKYLDCHQVLSVQVHPDDAYAQRMHPPDLGKTESWYVVDAAPGSLIYAGLREGIHRDQLREFVSRGRIESVLHSFEPRVGDCIFIPAGTIHALGAGLLVAEIQQSSDTTFRLFDWNRLGPDGHPRALHIKQALEVINYGRGPVKPQSAEPLEDGWDRLANCPQMELRRGHFSNSGQSLDLRHCGGFWIVTIVLGEVRLQCENSKSEILTLGDTALLPAALGNTAIASLSRSAIVLAMTQSDTCPTEA